MKVYLLATLLLSILFCQKGSGSQVIPDSNDSLDIDEINEHLKYLDLLFESIDDSSLSELFYYEEELGNYKEVDNKAIPRLKTKIFNAGNPLNATEEQVALHIKKIDKNQLKKCLAETKKLWKTKDLLVHCVGGKLAKAVAKALLRCAITFRSPVKCAVSVAMAIGQNIDLNKLKSPECKKNAHLWKDIVKDIAGTCKRILK